MKGKYALTPQERKHTEKGSSLMPRRDNRGEKASRPTQPPRARQFEARTETITGLFTQISAPIRWHRVGGAIFYEVFCLGKWRPMKPSWD